MRKVKQLDHLFSIIVLILLLYSCTTEKVDYVPISFEERIDKFNLFLQEFEVKPLQSNFFNGSNGSKILITRDAIEKFGITRIELFEAFDKETMLKAGLTTVSDGRLLESAGMIYVNVISDSGTKLDLSDTGCEIFIPKEDSLKKMKLFFGEGEAEINWKLSDKPDPLLKFSLDTTGHHGYSRIPILSDFYCFPLLKSGWVNADLFYSSKEVVDLSFTLPDVNMTATYNMVFQDFNGILSGRIDESGKLVFNQIPKGMRAKIISIGIDEKDIYLSVDDLKTNTKSQELSPLKKVSKEKMSKILGKL